MPKITASQNTRIKKQDKDSSLLPPDQVIDIKEGQTLAGEIFPSRGDSMGIKLAGNAGSLKAGETVYFYQPHFRTEGTVAQGLLASISGKTPEVEAKSIKLNVPYYAQCDSRADGYRYCNSHSNAMLVSFLNKDFEKKALSNGHTQPENYYISKLIARAYDTTDSDGHTAVLMKDFGIESYWSMTLSPEDVWMSLQIRIPVVVGVAYKDSGHIVVIVGYENGKYIVNDPYGIRSAANDYYEVTSTDCGREGAFDKYSKQIMDGIFWDQGDSARESGWGRIVTAIDGKPTGLKKGL